MSSPVTLGCGHTMDRECILNITRSPDTPGASCPVCRKSFGVRAIAASAASILILQMCSSVAEKEERGEAKGHHAAMVKEADGMLRARWARSKDSPQDASSAYPGTNNNQPQPYHMAPTHRAWHAGPAQQQPWGCCEWAGTILGVTLVCAVIGLGYRLVLAQALGAAAERLLPESALGAGRELPPQITELINFIAFIMN